MLQVWLHDCILSPVAGKHGTPNELSQQTRCGMQRGPARAGRDDAGAGGRVRQRQVQHCAARLPLLRPRPGRCKALPVPTHDNAVLLDGRTLPALPPTTHACYHSGDHPSAIWGPAELAAQVLLDGRDLRTLSLPWYRARVGLVSQEPTLFGTTIARNIAGLTDASDAAIVAAAQAANAHSFIMQLPLKCDTPADGKSTPHKVPNTPGTALLTSLHTQVRHACWREGASMYSCDTHCVHLNLCCTPW